jgi:hypothetical protein
MTRLTIDLASGVRRLEEQRDRPWLVMAAAISVAVFIGLLVSQMLGGSPNGGTIGLPDADASVAPEPNAAARPVSVVDVGDEAEPSASAGSSASPSDAEDSDEESGPLDSDGGGAARNGVLGSASGPGTVFAPGVPGAPSIPGLEPGIPPGAGPAPPPGTAPTPPPGTAPTPPPGTAPTPPPTTPPLPSQPPASTPPPRPTPEPPPPPTPDPPPPTPDPPPPTPDPTPGGLLPECADLNDNDGDGLIDLLDPGCLDVLDLSED